MLAKKYLVFIFPLVLVLIYSCGTNETGNIPTTTTTTTTITTTTTTTTTFPWTANVMVQPLPDNASSVRLTLPASIDKILISGGEIGPFGSHQGGHKEGLDHIWFYVTSEAQVGSWAQGEVTEISWTGEEYHVTVDYGDGLKGTHMEMQTTEVSVGDQVIAGQLIGTGMGFVAGKQSAELSLVDENRTDGIASGGSGVYVSPFDYLQSDVQSLLIASYEAQIVTPYLSQGNLKGSNLPWEPYLTNRLIFHSDYRGTLIGEWLLSNKDWVDDDLPDVLSFIATSEYYSNNRVAAAEDDSSVPGSIFWGTWEADYTENKIIIYNERPANEKVYYGIFAFGGTATRESLTFEYQENTYPSTFSAGASIYLERRPVSRRQDAVDMGVSDSL